MHVSRATAALLALIALLAAACSGDGDAPAATPTPAPALDAAALSARGPYGVGVMTATFVDGARPSVPPGGAGRELAVEIWYPAQASESPEQRDAALDASGAPYPLIVFAHGFMAFRRQSSLYAQHLASRGYVVISPDFPGSNISAPGGPRIGAVLDQPADVSNVITQLLNRAKEPNYALRGAVDGERIGLTGHSLGGLTALLTTYGPLRDDRIDAIVPFAAPGCLAPDASGEDAGVPALFIGGTHDRIVGTASIRAGYDRAPAPKWFVQLRGADQTRFIDLDISDERIGASVGARLGESDVTADALRIQEAVGADVSACLQRDALPETPTISAERQRELMRIYGAVFFDAWLKDDARARATLDALGDLAPEAEVVGE